MNEHDKLASALREVLTDTSPQGWLLLQRVPIICNDIKWIKRAIFAIFGLFGTLLVMLIAKANGL